MAKGFGIDVPDIFKAPPEPEWIYDKWFTLTDKVVVFTGDGGVGKTLLVGNLLVSMLRGGDFMGRAYARHGHTGQSETRPRVLYLDIDMGFDLYRHFAKIFSALGVREGDEHPWKERFYLTTAGQEHEDSAAPVFPLGYTFGRRAVDFDTLRDLVEATRPHIVVLDCWLDFCGMSIDVNKDTDVNFAIRQLRVIDPSVCWWIIHHETKNPLLADGSKKKVQHRSSGSHMLMGKAHRNLSVVRVKTRDTYHVNQVEWGKIRHGGAPKNFLYKFCEPGVGGCETYRMEFLEEMVEND